ncbi:hypothetical protein PRUB_b1157 [Pseudoalteromonas rubra]|uniref:Uncharacterized protein n=1 Tax=Pseudoalteromonas rubra TaxID=43658 RepID=A0A8T0C3I5_9GAMM|nr:hypothetical protein PRUB_b1157 [Pseudoalteromonas rubra]
MLGQNSHFYSDIASARPPKVLNYTNISIMLLLSHIKVCRAVRLGS